MKFDWVFSYVPKGQMEPDKFNRWSLNCYIFINLEVLSQYQWLKGMYEDDFMPVLIARIYQKGTVIGNVPSLIHRFAACIPSFDDCGNHGVSYQTWFYSDDVEELKKMVEEQFNKTKEIFLNTK